MRYSPYETYDQPEVDWLDEIPSHWEVRRTKTMLSLQKTRVGETASDHTLLSLTVGGVVPRDISEGGKLPAEFDTYQIVEPDDLVFCLFDIDETPRTIGIARDIGMITGAYSVYRANGSCVPEYVYYYFLHLDSFKGLRPFYTGLRKVVRADTFSKVQMPAPPYEEQSQIAKFLDHETAKIDALIEKQQQLIALLEEKRQAVISHAVTKGLNPDAPMRDSGVEWLGEVPAHWEVVQLRRLLAGIDQGSSPLASANPPDPGGQGVLKISAIKRGAFREDEAKSLDDTSFEERYRVRPGDLLVTRGNTPDLVADACVVSEEPAADLMMSDLIYRLNLSDLMSSRYLCFFLLSAPARIQIKNDARGSSMTMAKVSQSHIKAWLATLPPTEEQEQIVDHIEHMEERTFAVVDQCQSAIDLLQERRTALISAAVTGKIDVRNWKAA